MIIVQFAIQIVSIWFFSVSIFHYFSLTFCCHKAVNSTASNEKCSVLSQNGHDVLFMSFAVYDALHNLSASNFDGTVVAV
jgi:hypothetical protein